MKKLIAVLLLVAPALFVQPAQAQVNGQQGKGRKAEQARSRKVSGEDMARMQQRMSMNPDEAKRDQQMEVLEARAGGGTANTSFGRSAGPARQLEKGSGGFSVLKFKDKRGTALQKRGLSRPAGGIDPKGKPLTHKKKKRFLLF
ncbi:hypothetical protein SAMN02745146_3749 [Hymenobacter daecheongensis DSM 21074]|uniref:Uncharacterized protein n=1 Tax=Hymenobacter daecheongensis DSM 21074 TaxID=1121955 RepID=A0A1M6LG54_9BACT|nr:hypothetical protein [Hymenobacter daecheongensis]SHJ70189.1 hypothetical protein SAMN02745146_3749 [Hymenobacter daecheongensis DSM 21074]